MNTEVGHVQRQENTAGRAAWICLAIAWAAFVVPFPGLGLFVGWPVNFVAFVLAIVAMAKVGAGGGIWQLLASLVVSPIVYFIGLAIFTAGFFGGSHPRYDTQTSITIPIDRTSLVAFRGRGMSVGPCDQRGARAS